MQKTTGRPRSIRDPASSAVVADYVETWNSATDKASVLKLVNDARSLASPVNTPPITLSQLNNKMNSLRKLIPKGSRKRASGSGGSNIGVKRENPQLAPVDMASQAAPDVISNSMMRHLSPDFWSGCYAEVIEEEKKKVEGDQHTEDEEDDNDEITFDENIFTEEEDPEGGSADDGFEGNDVQMRPVGISSSSAQRRGGMSAYPGCKPYLLVRSATSSLSCCTIHSTMARWPLAQAMWRGVTPMLLRASSEAPFSFTSHFTMWRWLLSQA